MGVMPAIFGLILVWAFLAAVGLVYAEASAAWMNTSAWRICGLAYYTSISTYIYIYIYHVCMYVCMCIHICFYVYIHRLSGMKEQ